MSIKIQTPAGLQKRSQSTQNKSNLQRKAEADISAIKAGQERDRQISERKRKTDLEIQKKREQDHDAYLDASQREMEASLESLKKTGHSSYNIDYAEDYLTADKGPQVGYSRFDDMGEDGMIQGEANAADIEQRRFEQQNAAEQIGAGIVKCLGSVGTTVVGTTLGFIYGIGSAAKNQEFSRLWDNDVTQATNDFTEALNKALPNYQSKEQQRGDWSGLLSANGLASLIENSGFTIGAMIGTSLTMGFGEAVTGMSMVSRGLAAVRSTIGSRAYTISKMLVTDAYSAAGEAAVEAKQNSEQWAQLQTQKLNDSHDQIVYGLQELLKQNPNNLDARQRLVDEENAYQQGIKEIGEKKISMGNADYTANYPILMASNMIQFGDILRGGVKSARRVENALTRIKNVWAADRSTLGKVATIAERPLSEGGEELAQSIASGVSGDYYQNKVDNYINKKRDPLGTNEAFNLFDSITNAITDKQNLQGALQGALMGATGSPVVRKNDKGKWGLHMSGGMIDAAKNYQGNWEREKALAKKINDLEEKDPKYKTIVEGFIRNVGAQNEMDRFLKEGNTFEWKNSSFLQKCSNMAMYQDAGIISDFKTNVQNSLSSSDENLKEIYNATIDQATGKNLIYPNLDLTNPADMSKMRSIVDKKRKDTLAFVDEYLKERDHIDVKSKGVLSTEGLDTLTWMSLTRKDCQDRFESILNDEKTKTSLNAVKDSLQADINALNTSLGKRMNNKESDDLNRKKYMMTMIDDLLSNKIIKENLSQGRSADLQNLYNYGLSKKIFKESDDLLDGLKLKSLEQASQHQYDLFMEKPEDLEKKVKENKREADKFNKSKFRATLVNVLNESFSEEDFLNKLHELSDDVSDQELNDLIKEAAVAGNNFAIDYLKKNQINNYNADQVKAEKEAQGIDIEDDSSILTNVNSKTAEERKDDYLNDVDTKTNDKIQEGDDRSNRLREEDENLNIENEKLDIDDNQEDEIKGNLQKQNLKHEYDKSIKESDDKKEANKRRRLEIAQRKKEIEDEQNDISIKRRKLTDFNNFVHEKMNRTEVSASELPPVVVDTNHLLGEYFLNVKTVKASNDDSVVMGISQESPATKYDVNSFSVELNERQDVFIDAQDKIKYFLDENNVSTIKELRERISQEQDPDIKKAKEQRLEALLNSYEVARKVLVETNRAAIDLATSITGCRFVLIENAGINEEELWADQNTYKFLEKSSQTQSTEDDEDDDEEEEPAGQAPPTSGNPGTPGPTGNTNTKTQDITDITPSLSEYDLGSIDNQTYLKLCDLHPEFKPLYDKLVSYGAFDYVREGKLKVGEKLNLMIDPEFEEERSGQEPVIFMVTESGQVVGALRTNSTELEPLRNKVLKEYPNDAKEKFVSKEFLTVSANKKGLIPNSKETRPVKTIMKDGEEMNFAVRTDTDWITANGTTTDPNSINSTSKDKVAFMYKNNDGSYSLFPVTPLSADEFDYKAAIQDENNPAHPLAQTIHDAFYRLVEAYKADDEKERTEAIADINKVLYINTISIPFAKKEDSIGIIFGNTIVLNKQTEEKSVHSTFVDLKSCISNPSNGTSTSKKDINSEQAINIIVDKILCCGATKEQHDKLGLLRDPVSGAPIVSTKDAGLIRFQVEAKPEKLTSNYSYLKMLIDAGVITTHAMQTTPINCFFTASYKGEEAKRQKNNITINKTDTDGGYDCSFTLPKKKIELHIVPSFDVDGNLCSEDNPSAMLQYLISTGKTSEIPGYDELDETEKAIISKSLFFNNLFGEKSWSSAVSGNDTYYSYDNWVYTSINGELCYLNKKTLKVKYVKNNSKLVIQLALYPKYNIEERYSGEQIDEKTGKLKSGKNLEPKPFNHSDFFDLKKYQTKEDFINAFNLQYATELKDWITQAAFDIKNFSKEDRSELLNYAQKLFGMDADIISQFVEIYNKYEEQDYPFFKEKYGLETPHEIDFFLSKTGKIEDFSEDRQKFLKEKIKEVFNEDISLPIKNTTTKTLRKALDTNDTDVLSTVFHLSDSSAIEVLKSHNLLNLIYFEGSDAATLYKLWTSLYGEDLNKLSSENLIKLIEEFKKADEDKRLCLSIVLSSKNNLSDLFQVDTPFYKLIAEKDLESLIDIKPENVSFAKNIYKKLYGERPNTQIKIEINDSFLKDFAANKVSDRDIMRYLGALNRQQINCLKETDTAKRRTLYNRLSEEEKEEVDKAFKILTIDNPEVQKEAFKKSIKVAYTEGNYNKIIELLDLNKGTSKEIIDALLHKNSDVVNDNINDKLVKAWEKLFEEPFPKTKKMSSIEIQDAIKNNNLEVLKKALKIENQSELDFLNNPNEETLSSFSIKRQLALQKIVRDIFTKDVEIKATEADLNNLKENLLLSTNEKIQAVLGNLSEEMIESLKKRNKEFVSKDLIFDLDKEIYKKAYDKLFKEDSSNKSPLEYWKEEYAKDRDSVCKTKLGLGLICPEHFELIANLDGEYSNIKDLKNGLINFCKENPKFKKSIGNAFKILYEEDLFPEGISIENMIKKPHPIIKMLLKRLGKNEKDFFEQLQQSNDLEQFLSQTFYITIGEPEAKFLKSEMSIDEYYHLKNENRISKQELTLLKEIRFVLNDIKNNVSEEKDLKESLNRKNLELNNKNKKKTVKKAGNLFASTSEGGQQTIKYKGTHLGRRFFKYNIDTRQYRDDIGVRGSIEQLMPVIRYTQDQCILYLTMGNGDRSGSTSIGIAVPRGAILSEEEIKRFYDIALEFLDLGHSYPKVEAKFSYIRDYEQDIFKRLDELYSDKEYDVDESNLTYDISKNVKESSEGYYEANSEDSVIKGIKMALEDTAPTRESVFIASSNIIEAADTRKMVSISFSPSRENNLSQQQLNELNEIKEEQSWLETSILPKIKDEANSLKNDINDFNQKSFNKGVLSQTANDYSEQINKSKKEFNDIVKKILFSNINDSEYFAKIYAEAGLNEIERNIENLELALYKLNNPETNSADDSTKNNEISDDDMPFRRVDKSNAVTATMQEEIDWLENVLPQFSTEDRLMIIKGLLKVANEGSFAWGCFTKGMIVLSDEMARGTLYHEAFHAVFRTLLSENEMKGLIGEAREDIGNKSEIECEEYLAERFRIYTENKRQDKTSFLKRAWIWFKNLLFKTTHWNKLRPHTDELFYMINKSYYKNSKIQKEKEHDSLIRYSRVTDFTKEITEELLNSQDPNHVDELSSVIASLFQDNTVVYSALKESVKNVLHQDGNKKKALTELLRSLSHTGILINEMDPNTISNYLKTGEKEKRLKEYIPSSVIKSYNWDFLDEKTRKLLQDKGVSETLFRYLSEKERRQIVKCINF